MVSEMTLSKVPDIQLDKWSVGSFRPEAGHSDAAIDLNTRWRIWVLARQTHTASERIPFGELIIMSFGERYRGLEEKFKKQIDVDNDRWGVGSQFLANIAPDDPVDYVLIAMEPSFGGGSGETPHRDAHSSKNFSGPCRISSCTSASRSTCARVSDPTTLPTYPRGLCR